MSRTLLAAAVVLIGLTPGPVTAAPPTLNHLFPAGGGRGQAVEVTASGAFGRWPVGAWVDEPGVVFEPLPEKGKLLARVAPDALPGVRLVRLYDQQGASALRPFVVGTLPEAVEQEPNDEPDRAHELPTLPVVVNGRLGKRGDVDAFRVRLAKGQTVVAALEARRRLGSPMDGVLQLVSADGFVVEQADDSPGLDPLLTAKAPADGDYLVRVFAFPATPDSAIAFAGGDAFLYRLTLTTSGFLSRVIPSAVEAGQAGVVEAVGWNLPDGLRWLRAGPTADPDRLRAWHPRLAGDVGLAVVTHPSLVEAEPDPASEPQALPLPGSVSGRIGWAGDEDRFRVTMTKGRACRVRVASRTLGSPLDPVVSINDPAGKPLAERDGTRGRDPELTFNAPGDGAFDVTVRDLNGQGGPDLVYRLDLAEPRPDFALGLKDDRVTVAPGKPARVAETVTRRDGFADPIVLEVLGLPERVTSAPARSEPKGESAGSLTLTFEASAQTRPFSGPLTIVGRSGRLGRLARAPVAGLDADTDQPWLTVGPDGQPRD